MKRNAFTLIELVLVILIMGVVSTIAMRSMENTFDEKKYKATLNEMQEIGKALVGDATIVEGQTRIDYGHVGENGSFPGTAASIDLTDLSVSGFMYADAYMEDAWDNTYIYTNRSATGAPVTVRSLGADGAAVGSGLDEDIMLGIRSGQYTDYSSLLVICIDSRGILLRASATDTYNMISDLDVFDENGTDITATVTISRVYNCITVGTVGVGDGLPVGTYTLRVYVANGTGGANGTVDWRPYVNEGNNYFDVEIAVSPRWGEARHIVTIRLPGTVNTDLLG